jgi:hypothetical protein
MKRTSIHLREEQREVISQIVTRSQNTGEIPMLDMASLFRAVIDEGIDELLDGDIQVEGEPLSDYVDEDVAERWAASRSEVSTDE